MINLRKSILTLIVLVGFGTTAVASEFCEGFSQGYITGYKQAKGTKVEPRVPECPLKPVRGAGDPRADFEFGYTIGFKKGTSKGSNKS